MSIFLSRTYTEVTPSVTYSLAISSDSEVRPALFVDLTQLSVSLGAWGAIEVYGALRVERVVDRAEVLATVFCCQVACL
jgi:hypothetical protein